MSGAMAGILPSVLSPILGSEKASQYSPILQQAFQKYKSGGYKNSKEDLLRAIKEAGLSKRQLQGMMSVLDNPMAQNIFNRISPGLSNGLQTLGKEMSNDINAGNDAPVNQGGGTQSMFPPLKKR